MTTRPRSEPETTVGGWTLLARLGEGGMGVVHLARRGDGPRVALKVLRPQVVGDDDGRRRLEREVASLSRVRSRWVAEIVDADPWDDVPWIATRYVPGLSLHDHVVEEGVVGGADLLWFAGCLAEAVDAVHAVGVVHRDVKPSNVLMEGRTPVLIDFGLAKLADDPRLTQTGWLIGTPGYLAPEILYGEDATERSDVHSWAATVAYAGTGRAPFGRGPSAAVMDRVRRGEHDLAGLTGDLAAVVAAGLDPDPDRRPSLPEVLDWLRPQTTRVRRVVPPPPLPAGHPVPPPAETMPWQPAATPWDHTVHEPEDPTLVEGLPEDRWEDSWEDGWDDGWSRPQEVDGTRYLPWDDAQTLPVEPRASLAERVRRGTLVLLAGAGVTAAVVAVPLVVTTLVLLVVWLLRSGSLAASTVGERRRLRGRRWYDGPRLLLGAPFDLVRSIPSTLVLQGWALGLATAAGLLCYAAALGTTRTLAVAGAVLALGLWAGPGGSRVRSPVGRVVRPLSATAGTWLVAAAVTGALAAGAAYAAQQGTDWAPLQERPWSDVQAPAFLSRG